MKNSKKEETFHHIPNIEIIDLEAEDSPDLQEDDYLAPEKKSKNIKFGSFLSHINLHIVLLVVAILFVAGIAYRVMNWGVIIDLDDIFKNVEPTYDNSYDFFLPLLDAEGGPLYMNYGEGSTIVAFGNAPFADDRGSTDNLANMIEEMSGATVYNCSLSGSYLAAQWSTLSVDESPADVFTFYWLCTLATSDVIDNTYLSAVEVLGENAPPEAMEVFNTLKSVDFNTVDVITLMYDGSDYLAGHEMYNDENATDIMQFTGNMMAGIELLQAVYPHIRIIVMSPPYAYGIDENGDYISSDIQRYGQDLLSTYAIKQYGYCYDASISYVDHLYGTITEDNASKYLIDNLHLNTEGRKKVAERFVKALQYFNEDTSQ